MTPSVSVSSRPDVKEPCLAVGDVVPEALAPVRVLHRRDDTGGLVQREELERLRGHGEPVDLDLVLLRLDPQALLDDDTAVDLDPGSLDQLLTGTPRTVSGAGQHLLEPLALLLGSGAGSRGLGLLPGRLLGIPLAVALLGACIVLTRARGHAAPAGALLLGLFGPALGAAARRRAPALLRRLAAAGTRHVVAPLLGAWPALVSAAAAGGTSRRVAPSGRRPWGGLARPPRIVGGAASAVPAAASHHSSVLSSASSESGASGSNDGTPSCVSASIAAASGRKGASSGSSSRPRRPIRSRK